MYIKSMMAGVILAVAPFSLDPTSCSSAARAQECAGPQCPPGEHGSLAQCYDGCDWKLNGDLIFCQVVSPDILIKTVCQTIAHNEWSNCYRNCLR